MRSGEVTFGKPCTHQENEHDKTRTAIKNRHLRIDPRSRHFYMPSHTVTSKCTDMASINFYPNYHFVHCSSVLPTSLSGSPSVIECRPVRFHIDLQVDIVRGFRVERKQTAARLTQLRQARRVAMPKAPTIAGPTPLLTTTTTSIDFGPNPPSLSISQQIGLSVGGTGPIKVSMSMQSGNNGFSAKLLAITHTLHGGVTQSVIASTSGPITSATIGPSDLNKVPITSLMLEVDFNVPTTPVPNAWSDNVVLSYPQGSDTEELFIAVTGSSAQFTANVSSSQPIKLTPGGNGKVAIEIRYNTVDTSPINVTAALATYSPLPVIPGLTAIPTTAIMSAEYAELAPSSGGKKGPVTTSPLNPEKVLIPFRSATLEVQVSAGVLTEPGDNQQAAFSVSAPNLAAPFAILPLQVSFNIPPLPIKISPPANTVNLIAGQSASATLNVKIAGANTTINMGPPSSEYTGQINNTGPGSGTAPIAVSWPNGVAQLSDGENIISISAPASATGVATVSLPWSAYDGLTKGTVQFQVNVLPQTAVFGGNYTYAQMTGSWQWLLNVAGYSYFMGNAHVPSDEVASQSYAIGAALIGVLNPANQLLWVSHSGTIGSAITGVAFGDETDSFGDASQWNGPSGWINTSDPTTILSAWYQICFGNTQFAATYSPDIGEIFSGIFGGILPLGAIGQGLHAIPSISCSTSDGDDGDDGGGTILSCA
jgi:hypothetical protein